MVKTVGRINPWVWMGGWVGGDGGWVVDGWVVMEAGRWLGRW